MRLTHLGSSSPVSVHLVFVCAQLSLFAGVVSWALVIRAWGSLLSALSLSSVLLFVVTVAVLGAGLSFVGAASLCMGGGCSFAGGVHCSWLGV